MKLIKATENEIDELLLFYREVAEKDSPCSRWVYGVYPTDKIIKDHVLNGSMYFKRQNGLISSAVAITDQIFTSICQSGNAKIIDVLHIHALLFFSGILTL